MDKTTILTIVSSVCDIPAEEFEVQNRRRPLVDAKHIYRALASSFVTPLSSCGDHATVIHSRKTFLDLHRTDVIFKARANECMEKLFDKCTEVDITYLEQRLKHKEDDLIRFLLTKYFLKSNLITNQ